MTGTDTRSSAGAGRRHAARTRPSYTVVTATHLGALTMDDLARVEHLAELADLVRPAAIRTAATLGVADHIAAGVHDTTGLARRCETRADVLDSLLRYLASLELLDRDGNGGYVLRDAAAPLLSDHPLSLREALRLDGVTGRSDTALLGLVHTVRTGEPAHVGLFGRGYWDSLNEDATHVEAIERAGLGQLVFDAELIRDAYDWSAVRSVVDVGGNTGAILTSLLRPHPHLRGTLVDLPSVARVAAGNIAGAGLEDRCEVAPGSFFDPLPAGRDVYLLSAILGDWDDEQAVRILRRCAEAAGETGKVLLADVNLEMVMRGERAARMELLLRAMMPTPVRTVEELRRLGHEAGLRVTWEGPVTPVRSLIEFSVQESRA
ncbi:methyltransferase [Streptomyces halobius]|uniref:Methyltransferase n=1 Tax=Streptomyces halobius TaxID=2879846 RepID=A0ABY4M9H0_9ACTN|nr:methyltransferase [Streptomyces halobius]UQA94431.1 methyltransferase [Streptomyces halobius]